jgi:thioredoxin 1
MAKRVRELYDDTFQETLRGSDLVFIDFYTDWCGPCKAVAPVIERVAKQYEGRITFGRLNTEGNPETAKRYRISSVPTLVLFRGGEPIMRTGGFQPDAALIASLARFAPSLPSMGTSVEPATEKRGGSIFNLFRRGK